MPPGTICVKAEPGAPADPASCPRLWLAVPLCEAAELWRSASKPQAPVAARRPGSAAECLPVKPYGSELLLDLKGRDRSHKNCSAHSRGRFQRIPLSLRRLTRGGRQVFSMHSIQRITG